MADVKKIATRDSYGNALKELGALHENLVVLDADLAGATKTGTFQKAFPERHFDCGIAESNMTAVAAGLSTTGLVPFVSTFARFPAWSSSTLLTMLKQEQQLRLPTNMSARSTCALAVWQFPYSTMKQPTNSRSARAKRSAQEAISPSLRPA